MPEKSPRRIPQEHLDVLKRSGLLNPDLTLEQVISAAAEIDVTALQTETSVPTLIGPFYVYHSIEAIEETVTSPTSSA